MGRKRKDDSQGLSGTRLYLRRGTFFYVHPNGKWENVGKDLGTAKKRAAHYNDPTGAYGTMAWFLDQFLISFRQLVAAGKRAARTLEDYEADVVPIKAFFGTMLPTDVGPHHVSEYLEIGAKEAAPSVPTENGPACPPA